MSARHRFALRKHLEGLASLISDEQNEDYKRKIMHKILVTKKATEAFFSKFPDENLSIPQEQFDIIREFLKKGSTISHQEFLEILNKIIPSQQIITRRIMDPDHLLAKAIRYMKRSKRPYKCCETLYSNYRALGRHIQRKHPEAYQSGSSSESSEPLELSEESQGF